MVAKQSLDGSRAAVIAADVVSAAGEAAMSQPPGLHRSRTRLDLGMPHTRSYAISEVALLSQAIHLRWSDMSAVAGCPASRQRDAQGRPVYASVYYAEVGGFPEQGLATWGPDDSLEIVSTLGRFGRTMLDGVHLLYAAGTLPDPLPDVLPAAPFVRLSNVLVGLGRNVHDLQISTPVNARIDALPAFDVEPDSYAMIRRARTRGRFFEAPEGAESVWVGTHQHTIDVDPDRDLNGVGLLYFCNYVAFMDAAERRAFTAHAPEAPERITLRRQIGFYGNALPGETLVVEVEAQRLPGGDPRWLVHHRITRRGDGRLIAVASAERIAWSPAN